MKTLEELEQVIRDTIMDIYHKEYTGKISVQKLPVGYCIKLGMNTPDQPITIYAELEGRKFLEFLRQEIKDRRFNLVFYGSVNLREPTECQERNTACGCHDKRRTY